MHDKWWHNTNTQLKGERCSPLSGQQIYRRAHFTMKSSYVPLSRGFSYKTPLKWKRMNLGANNFRNSATIPWSGQPPLYCFITRLFLSTRHSLEISLRRSCWFPNQGFRMHWIGMGINRISHLCGRPRIPRILEAFSSSYEHLASREGNRSNNPLVPISRIWMWRRRKAQFSFYRRIAWEEETLHEATTLQRKRKGGMRFFPHVSPFPIKKFHDFVTWKRHCFELQFKWRKPNFSPQTWAACLLMRRN